MLFNSYEFLRFLPLVWAGYFLLNRFRLYRTAQGMLIAASFVFYGFGDYRLCLLLAFSIGVNYLFHLGLMRFEKTAARRLLLAVGMLTNLGLLFYFKYLDFTITNLNQFFGAKIALRNIVLPLGISFYTFQQLSFVADSYRGETERYRFLDYCLFVSFFPQLVAGPIVLHRELIPQFRDLEKRRINYDNLHIGMEYFIIGFAKKVLVADTMARICDAGYDNLQELSSVSAILTLLAFTLQIYYDFSGYCDMAVGLGRMFNFTIPINFDSPYKAVTISDFWKRWHMTLTRFLTTYLYIPLGGNRRGKFRTCVNVMIVFTVSGIWHGAAWTYVLWGMLHGAAMVLYRVGKRFIDRLPRWLLWTFTFVFVNAAWAFFRAEFFRQPFYMLAQVVKGGFGGIHGDMAAVCENTLWSIALERQISASALQNVYQAVTALWILVWTAVCVRLPSSHEIVARRNRTTGYYICLGALFAWSFMWLSQVSTFIYFNF